MQNFMIHNLINRGVISWLNREVCSESSKAFSFLLKWFRNHLTGQILNSRCKVVEHIQGWKEENAIKKEKA